MTVMKLTNENIGRTVAEMQTFFEKNGAEHSYILRMRLAVEEMLLAYRDKFGEDTEFSVETGGLFRVRRCEIRVMCDEYDPAGENGENRILRNLMEQNELVPHWDYLHRCNRILCSFYRKMKISGNVWLLLAVAAALLLGLLAKGKPDGLIGNFCTTVMNPVSATIMRIMGFFASFMIFWSIILGICSMGDVSTFNKVGKKIIRRFLGIILAAAVGATAYFLLRTPMTAEGGKAFEFGPVVTMILDIVPKDPFTPFINGNTLQLMFVAFVMGIILLILKTKIGSTLPDIVRDLSEVSNCILSSIVTLMPAVVFTSLFQLVVNNDLSGILGSLEYPLTVIGLSVAVLAVVFTVVCVTRKVSPGLLLKKIWPPMQITLSTSSSNAAYLKTTDTCEHQLGIDPRLVRIGVPLGPTLMAICKPLTLLSIVFLGIRWYGLPLNVPTAISIVLSTYLLGIAAPPIPGGMTSVYLILLTSFGIPEEMMAIVLAFDAVIDRLGTTINQSVLMLELTQVGASLKMADEETLRKPVK